MKTTFQQNWPTTNVYLQMLFRDGVVGVKAVGRLTRLFWDAVIIGVDVGRRMPHGDVAVPAVLENVLTLMQEQTCTLYRAC